MSGRTDETQTPIVSNVQEHRCPQCGGMIAPECVFGRNLEDRLMRLIRRVQVWCDHCALLAEADCLSLDGRLVVIEQRIVRAPNERRKVLRRIAAIRGDEIRPVGAGGAGSAGRRTLAVV